MKKFLSLILCFSMMISIVGYAYNPTEESEQNDIEYNEYIQLVEEGIIGEDVSYEYWKELKELSKGLESSLNSSSDFSLVFDSRVAGTYAAAPMYSMKSGDILVTNGTFSAGMFGHAGIAISSTQILHIAGPGETPTVISLSVWNTEYTYDDSSTWTKIYRPSNSTVGAQAGSWANKTYRNSDAQYMITTNLASTSVTYCSKIVWQAYYYGPSTPSATGSLTRIVLPYDLPDTISNTSHIWTIVNN